MSDFARLRRTTPARLDVGRAGSRPRTATLLQFRRDHAAACDAVWSEWPPEFAAHLEELGFVMVASQAGSRQQYVLNPPLGRRLAAGEAERIRAANHLPALTPSPSPKMGEGDVSIPPLPSWERGLGGEGARWNVPLNVRQQMVESARDFRKVPTSSEARLWQALRGRALEGRKFRRQQPIGPFVVDFFCAEERLVVEVDGPVHLSQAPADRSRQESLESLGLRFVRVSAALVETQLEEVLSHILQALTPSPSPKVGEGDASIPPLPPWERGPGGEGIQLVLSDGLSATAGQQHCDAVIPRLLEALGSMGRLAVPVAVRNGRVAIGDQIAAAAGAVLVVHLIGERPGLATAASLGCYLTHAPSVSSTDADRKCISNIHAGGLNPAEAAVTIAGLARRILAAGTSRTDLVL